MILELSKKAGHHQKMKKSQRAVYTIWNLIHQQRPQMSGKVKGADTSSGRCTRMAQNKCQGTVHNLAEAAGNYQSFDSCLPVDILRVALRAVRSP